jgi:hypothetical protein
VAERTGGGYWAVQLHGYPFDLEAWRDLLPLGGTPAVEVKQSPSGETEHYLVLTWIIHQPSVCPEER